MNGAKLAVVIPCYRVREQILKVLATIEPQVTRIYVVDDQCPELTGKFVESQIRDPRVKVLYNKTNLGVGGAVITGYRAAIQDGADILVKIDGDGQMDPSLVQLFVEPILAGRADYVKGNRFYSLEDLRGMPAVRLIGNIALSFISKLVTGYWDVMDPTNGYTAIHAAVAASLPLHKLSHRYFFESDMLFRLSIIRAVVNDVPMRAQYADENSNLQITRVLFSFPGKYVNRLAKRILYNYYFRDFNFGSLMLVVGTVLFGGGGVYGVHYLLTHQNASVAAPSGVVMLAALPVILGFQSLIYFFQYDISAVPRASIHRSLELLNRLRGKI